MKRKNFFKDIFKNAFKNVLMFVLVISMLCTPYMPVSAKELLGAGDTFIYVDMYSVEANGKFKGTFFKHNNSLYIETETLLNMAPLVEYQNESGETISFARRDVKNAEFVVGDYETFTYKDVIYYPYIEAMTDLCIDTTFDRKRELVRVIPARSVWDIYSATDPMYNNVTYKMWNWQTADKYDAETSRVLAQATDIGRKLYALPTAIYDYASGTATYEQYRAALSKIMYPNLDLAMAEIAAHKDRMKYLTMIEYRGDVTKMNPENGESETGYNEEFCKDYSASAKAASLVGKVEKLAQVEESLKIMEYYANMENMNESIARGIELVSRTGNIDIQSLTEAFDDTVEINSGEKSMWNALLEQKAEGLVEVIIGDLTSAANDAAGSIGINATATEFWVNTMDMIGEEVLGENYTTFQVDSVITATSNLHIQDAARRSFYYYKVLYETTENTQKKMEALQNMRDTTLIYMLAGHNAWKALEFDSTIATDSKATVEEMAEHIEYLLEFSASDFSVYQHAQDTKYAISALGDWRDQYIYMFDWDEAKGNEVGGLEFSLEGKDEDGLGFLCKKVFSYQYYQQDGMLVGNIRSNSRTDSYTRTVEVLKTEGVCEIVIRPKTKGTSVADVGMTVYTGSHAKEWTKGLSDYLVTEEDGTVVYRIPVVLGSGVSKGDALPTTRVDSKFDFSVPIVDGKVGEVVPEETGYDVEVVETTYVPTGPFNGKYSFTTNIAKYTLNYNDNIFCITTSWDPSLPYVGYADNTENIITENICQLSVVDWDFNRYYQGQKNLYDDSYFRVDYPVENIKEIRFDNAVVKYFTISEEDADIIDGTVYFFYIELGDGLNIIGSWGEKANEGKAIEVFEHFIVEILGQMDVERFD